jgi:hypothetical protein
MTTAEVNEARKLMNQLSGMIAKAEGNGQAPTPTPITTAKGGSKGRGKGQTVAAPKADHKFRPAEGKLTFDGVPVRSKLELTRGRVVVTAYADGDTAEEVAAEAIAALLTLSQTQAA